MFIGFPHTKFSIPFTIGPLVMTVRLKDKFKISHIPILLVLIQHKENDHSKSCIYVEDLLPYVLSELFSRWR
jgi:hypothetical protein